MIIRFLSLIPLIILAACGHVVTLYPRDGGEQATGILNDGSRNISVILKGITYSGQYIRGQTLGIGFGQTFGTSSGFGSAVMIGSSSQSVALLVSADGKSVLRCELNVVAAIGGNGVCIDKDNITYDMNIKAR